MEYRDNGEHLEEYIRTDPEADLRIAQTLGRLLREERISNVRAQIHAEMERLDPSYNKAVADKQIDAMAEAFA